MSRESQAGDTSSGASPGQMLYHLFSSEERRRIVSIYLDNHAVAFSAAALSDATGMDETTADAMLRSLAAVGFLAEESANEAYQLAASEEETVQRIAGDVNESDRFYRLNKGHPVANALAKADSAAGDSAAAFFRAAPDIDLEI